GRTRSPFPTHRSAAGGAPHPTTGRMNNTLLNGFVFAAGLLAVCWIGGGYIGTHALALAVTALIGVLYLIGGLELLRYRRATATLVAALDAPPVPAGALAGWLDRLDGSLR